MQFGNGSWLCFDLTADPTWRTTTEDPAVVLPLAQAMLTWRSEHTRPHDDRHGPAPRRRRPVARPPPARRGQSRRSQQSAAVTIASMPVLSVGSWTGA